jgi:hypothetical protein
MKYLQPHLTVKPLKSGYLQPEMGGDTPHLLDATPWTVPDAGALPSSVGNLFLFGALKFIWNATRGHRLAPWRSEYLRWRVETYSGKPAETLRTRDIFAFMWESKWELLSFLFWTGQVQKEARRRP